MKLLLLDLDGTIRRSLAGETFINDPYDQELMPGALEAITGYFDDGFTIFGITNQGGVAAGHKSLQECVLEQRRTIELCLGCLELIFFCPGDGQTLHCVDAQDARLVKSYQSQAHAKHSLTGFRKPCSGMLRFAMTSTGEHPDWTCMVGDRPEDEVAAFHAGCQFLDAHLFRNPDTRTQWRSPRTPDQVKAAWLALQTQRQQDQGDGAVSDEGPTTRARGT